MSSFEIAQVDSFTTGTTGPQGERTFFLQAIAGDAVVSLKLEKQQVIAMAEYLAELLADLPEINAQDWTTAPDLVVPVEPLWVVGSMGAAYEASSDSVVLMAEEAAEDPDDESDTAVATFRLARGQTVAFIERARAVVEAGRPPCSWCSRPLNFGEDGFCPCWN